MSDERAKDSAAIQPETELDFLKGAIQRASVDDADGSLSNPCETMPEPWPYGRHGDDFRPSSILFLPTFYAVVSHFWSKRADEHVL